MLLYRDIISGDEMFNDTFPIEVYKDVLYKVKCKMVKEVDSGDYNTGGNPSAEEAGEDLEASCKQGLDVVIYGRLNEAAPFGKKKEYQLCLKEYLGRLKEKISEEENEELKAKLPAALKDLMNEFKKLEFYTGEKNDPDAMLAILNWEIDETVPYMYFIKAGLQEEKS